MCPSTCGVVCMRQEVGMDLEVTRNSLNALNIKVSFFHAGKTNTEQIIVLGK